MIFLATNKRDITTDFVVLELRRREIPFVRFNTEDAPIWRVSFVPGAGWTLSGHEGDIRLDDVRGAYFRRPLAPVPVCNTEDTSAVEYCVDEWSAVLHAIWNVLEGRWLNSPFSIDRAEDKPRQLDVARSVGFQVPDTLVTNDFDAAKAFVEDGGDAIGKPLRHALIEDTETGRIIFTNRLTVLSEADREAFGLAPVILQREVRKACDLRVTVVGDRVFAAEIHSQETVGTEIDWRRGSDPTLPHVVALLPDEIANACILLTKKLGLRFGAIDLIRDQAGAYWFLEINPNGQWAWIEKRTGQPISAAIVDLLTETR